MTELNHISAPCDQAEIKTIGVVIPTLNAGRMWSQFLSALLNQVPRPRRILVIDSSSTDQTVELARAAGLEVLQISRSEFSHGGTRHRAIEYLDDCDIVVFLTQDALLVDNAAIATLTGCFADSEIAVAYGRQLPHQSAGPIEAHARLFNYRDISVKKNLAVVGAIGMKVFFCSNSFSAYRRTTYFGLGGFRKDLFFGEDAEFAARAIKAGFSNYYCATGAVYHSHDYSVLKELKRHFDIGAFHAQNYWLLETFGSARGEGFKFAASELKYLLKRAPWSIPRAMCSNVAKVIGYKLGRMQHYLPQALKHQFSMSKKV